MEKSIIAKRKQKKEQMLSVLLVLWVYVYAIFYFVPLLLPENPWYMYLVQLGIAIIALIYSGKIRKNSLIFFVIYILLALINMVIVTYKYYVAIDAISGLAVFAPAIIIVGSRYFRFEKFCELWKKVAIVLTFFSPIVIALMNLKLIDYGVYTYLNLPNVIVLAYKIITKEDEKNKKTNLILALVNCIIIFVFGGRMAALVALFAVFVSCLMSSTVDALKKMVLILGAMIILSLIFINWTQVLQLLVEIMERFNIRSRTMLLLLEQSRGGQAGIYMTGRDYLYEEMSAYIIKRLGFPGGFGVSLYITNGKYYHPHNLILQLFSLLGIIGTIVFVCVIIKKVIYAKREYSFNEYSFVILCIVVYIVFSLTGASILTSTIAILPLAFLFFFIPEAKKDVTDNESKRRIL